MTSHDDDRLDLSALDPTRDAARFERLARSLAARALAQQQDSRVLLLRWWRPALALAAAMALLAWAPVLVAGSGVASRADPTETLLQWARGGAPASAADILASLGGAR